MVFKCKKKKKGESLLTDKYISNVDTCNKYKIGCWYISPSQVLSVKNASIKVLYVVCCQTRDPTILIYTGQTGHNTEKHCDPS